MALGQFWEALGQISDDFGTVSDGFGTVGSPAASSRRSQNSYGQALEHGGPVLSIEFGV
jgi:hypothetical protein